MGLVIDFSYPTCLGCGKTKKIINFLENKEEFVKLISHILSKMIPEISKKSLSELKNSAGYHTHPLDANEINIAIGLLREIVKNNYGYSNDEAERWLDNHEIYLQKLWQVSCPDSKGIRIIGYPIENSSFFRVLFIDYYHQIYKDEKHNEKDISKNSFSVLEYTKGEK